MIRRLVPLAPALAALICAAPSAAQSAGTTPPAIPPSPLALNVDEFTGAPAKADPHRRLRVPRNPYLARNPNSNIHNDSYESDLYNRSGPLGDGISVSSALFARECASVTFDTHGRIVTVCVGLDHPVLTVLDPTTLTPLSAIDLPPRSGGNPNPFQNFAGGGYFYLDHRDRAVVPNSQRHVLTIAVTAAGGLVPKRDYDLSSVVPGTDAIIAVMPDFRGRIWFISTKGIVGWIERRSGRVHARDIGQPIGNSFAVGRRGVFIVSDAAMYRFSARRGKVHADWRKGYGNVGVVKPGQTEAGSGTTPTLIGGRYLAITDNADPMHVLVYKRGVHPKGRRLVCRKAVFAKGASSTDQSLIGVRRTIIVENNYGHTGPASVLNGATTSPGIERIDIRRRGHGCRRVWRSQERAPSVVPKLSVANGLLYSYTKPVRNDSVDAWYLTAIDLDSGKTAWRRLAGTGFGFNNNFAPVSLGPDRTAYVGVLGGIVRFADGP